MPLDTGKDDVVAAVHLDGRPDVTESIVELVEIDGDVLWAETSVMVSSSAMSVATIPVGRSLPMLIRRAPCL